MLKRIGKWFLQNACVWMLGAVMFVPALQWIGAVLNRELVLYAPQYENSIRAAVMVVLSVLACIGRRETSDTARFCSFFLLPVTALMDLFTLIGSTYLSTGIYPVQGIEMIAVLTECIAAAAAYVACSGRKIGHALGDLGIGLLFPAGVVIALLWPPMWVILGIGLIVCIFLMGWKCLGGMLGSCLAALMVVLSFFVSLSMTEYRVDVSAEVISPDGEKAARLVHPRNALECGQQLKIYESGRAIWVGIGHLRKVENINLKGEYAHVFDEETQEFLPLSWQDNSTVLLDGDAVRRDETLPFARYIDVLTKDDDGNDIIRCYALGAKKTWAGENQFRQVDELFASDGMEVYEVNRSHCTKLTEEQDLLWQSKHWVSVIGQVEKDGELSEPDEVMKRMFELVHEQAEHWIINLRVYKVGDEYFIRTMLNVNLWTPYELFWYDAEKDELVLLHTFDGQEIVGIRLREGFLSR